MTSPVNDGHFEPCELIIQNRHGTMLLQSTFQMEVGETVGAIVLAALQASREGLGLFALTAFLLLANARSVAARVVARGHLVLHGDNLVLQQPELHLLVR